MRTTVGIAILGTVLLASCSQGQNISVPVPIQHQSQSVFGPSSAARPRTSTETLYGTTQAGGSSSCRKLNFQQSQRLRHRFFSDVVGIEEYALHIPRWERRKEPERRPDRGLRGFPLWHNRRGRRQFLVPAGLRHGIQAYSYGSLYSERVLYAFRGGSDGVSPNAKLLADSQGALYGTTALGGASGCRCVEPLSNCLLPDRRI